MEYLVDTNVLVYAIKNKVDLHELLGKKPLIAEQVLKELENLKSKDAKLTLQVIKAQKFKTIDLGFGHTDNLLLNYAKTHDVIIITNDSRLRKRLEKANLPCKFLKQGKILGE